jgi:hypothetical protein
MTTENRDSYIALGYSDLGVITAHEQGDVAYIPLNRQITLWLGNPAKARELLAAAFEALRILDPDGTVTVRTENEEIHTLAEILPGRAPAACGLDECDCHDAPAPDLVTPPAVSAAEAAGLLLPRCTSRRCVLRAGHDGVHEDADGNEAAEADLAPCAADDEPWCGANTRTEDGPFGCTAVAGHEGSHVAYGPQDQVCHTWPQAAKASTL